MQETVLIGRRELLTSGAALMLAASPARWTRAQGPSAPCTALVGAQWWNGEGFAARTGWSCDGRFTFRRPARIDTEIDLGGTYLVPPFADAHSHALGTGIPGFDAGNAARYLADGVFYVQSQGNLPLSTAERAALRLSTSDGPDATFANATITAHDDALVAFFATSILPRGMFPGYTLETLENVRYFAVDSTAELDAKWPLIRAQGSDFLKAYLWRTDGLVLEGLPPPLRDKTALSPEVFAALVARAHAERLRVSAHVTTAGDFRVAVRMGANEIAHVPAFGEIASDDARECARRGIPVVSTAALAARTAAASEADPAGFEPPIASLLRNHRTLKAAGVTLLIGTDTPSDTSVEQAAFFQQLGYWDNAALLRMWSGATPRAIFPDRKIGELREGYEASFLALADDPLRDWNATRRIALRMKQGVRLEVGSERGP